MQSKKCYPVRQFLHSVDSAVLVTLKSDVKDRVFCFMDMCKDLENLSIITYIYS